MRDGGGEIRSRLHATFDPLHDDGSEPRVLQRFREARDASGRAARTTWWPLRTPLGAALTAVSVVAVVGGLLAVAVGLRNTTTSTPAKPSHQVSPMPIVGSPSASPTQSPAPPAGFDPLAFTAISPTQFWVLGTNGFCAPCAPIIERTKDGGKTFISIPAPPAKFAPYYQNADRGTVSDLRFANPSDGWAFGRDLWATHDGGAHWRSIDSSGGDIALEPGSNGRVFAVIEGCIGSSSCARWLMRADASGDAWTNLLSVPGNAPLPSLAVHGDDVWLMASPDLWHSSNGGATFVKLKSPCYADLGGNISAATPTVIWAFCATGLEGGPLVSTDAGASFRAIRAVITSGSFSNGGRVVALSALKCYVVDGPVLAVTTDGGATFGEVSLLAGGQTLWAGFTDPKVGYALVNTPEASSSQLWRTTDGGSSWAAVEFS